MTKTTYLYTILIVLLVAAVGIGLYFSGEKPQEAKGMTLHLLGNDCDDCFNLSLAKEYIEQQGLNITETKEYSIKESLELAEKYSINVLPAVIITETGNKTVEGFEEREGALVFDQPPAPYYNITQEKINGKVTLTILEANCEKCIDIKQVSEDLEELGIVYGDKKIVQAGSEESKQLIEKYSIEKLPTILLDEELSAYQGVAQIWQQIGTKEDDMFVLRFVAPPYLNVSTGKTEGLVKITYLTDEKCDACFDAEKYRETFEQGFNIAFVEEETIDVNSGPGRKIVHDYDIELIPTVIMSKELRVYPVVGPMWEEVGTVEENGDMVFRKVPSMSYALRQEITYRNLTSGEITDTTNLEIEQALNDMEQAEQIEVDELVID